MQKYSKLQIVPVVCGALMLSAVILSGCGQKDTPVPPPAAVTPPAAAVNAPAAAVPKGGMNPHQATLQAQSDYWRKHGQGLNETPPSKPKQ